MKRIEAMNGYTIMQATARDVNKYNVEEGMFYIYFSSDLREYGLSMSDPDWECDSIEVAREWCSGTNFAIAREIVEARSTAASFEEIEEIEKLLDAGMSADEIEEIEDEEIDPNSDPETWYYYRFEDVTGTVSISAESEAAARKILIELGHTPGKLLNTTQPK
jgi:hypothetical protein